jgi:TM2 domain-containing membrane protein YozV
MTKDVGIATVLSFFFTGVGQIYNGQIGKGIALIVVQMLNLALIFVLVGLVTFPLTWIYGIWDAKVTAERLNAEEVTAARLGALEAE